LPDGTEAEERGSGANLVGEGGESKVPASSMTSWAFKLKGQQNGPHKVHVKAVLKLFPEDAAEWSIRLLDAAGGSLFDNHSSRFAPESDVKADGAKVTTHLFDIKMEGPKTKDLVLEAHAPVGAAYQDRVTVDLDMAGSTISFAAEARQSIMALKTSIGHEKDVADGISGKAKSGKSDMAAILAPVGLRGYVLIEGMNTDKMRETVKGVRKAHSFVDGEMSFQEIDHYLTPKSQVSGITEGDVVELVAGPFKGEKARVQQIDESKEEITVELFEAMVPIPVTVRGDHVRVLEKDR